MKKKRYRKKFYAFNYFSRSVIFIKSIRLKHKQNIIINDKRTDFKNKKNNKLYKKWSNLRYLKTNTAFFNKINLVSDINNLFQLRKKLKVKELIKLLLIVKPLSLKAKIISKKKKRG